MNLSTARFLVIDVETTGEDPAVDKVVEIAFRVTTVAAQLAAGSSLVNPGIHIPPEASAIHHLVDEDVAGAPNLLEVLNGWTETLRAHGPFDAYVAHNAPFDAAFLPMLTKAPWLDTLRLCKRLRPAAKSHKNEVMRYAEHLEGPGILEGLPHRADHDTAVTAALLRKLMGEINGSSLYPQTVDELILDLAKPMLLGGPVAFGKHKGTPWPEVPKDYLTWISKQAEMDPDVMFTARHYLHTS